MPGSDDKRGTDVASTSNFMEWQERRMTRQIAGANLLMIFSLLLSAVVQAKSSEGLTAYHATIILNMCWMSVFTAYWSWMRGVMGTFWTRPRFRVTFALSFFVILATCLGGVGLWTWVTISTFGGPLLAQCNNSTIFSLVFKSVTITNPVLRIVSITVYAITATPVVFALIPINLMLFGFIALIPITIIVVLIVSFKFRRVDYPMRIIAKGISLLSTMEGCRTLSLLGTVTCDLLLVASTELTVAQNHVGSGQRAWTFGQTFALSVLIPSLWDAYKAHQDEKVIRQPSYNEDDGDVDTGEEIVKSKAEAAAASC